MNVIELPNHPSERQRIGVVGAGMAGLTAARILSDQGQDVVVVEKARGAGGRIMATHNQRHGNTV